jgi:hypothetical protein
MTGMIIIHQASQANFAARQLVQEAAYYFFCILHTTPRLCNLNKRTVFTYHPTYVWAYCIIEVFVIYIPFG